MITRTLRDGYVFSHILAIYCVKILTFEAVYTNMFRTDMQPSAFINWQQEVGRPEYMYMYMHSSTPYLLLSFLR